MSASRIPTATPWTSLASATLGFRSSGRVSVLSVSHTPTASTITKCVLRVASGVTFCSSASATVRVPRPFIWSKYAWLLTSRMNSRHSSGCMSVPVAIMSTVTAMRGL